MADNYCFVCHSDIPADQRQRKQQLTTVHTHRSVFGLLDQFLGYTVQEERSESSRWCDGCLERVNDYDWAMQTANRRETELIALFMNAVKTSQLSAESDNGLNTVTKIEVVWRNSDDEDIDENAHAETQLEAEVNEFEMHTEVGGDGVLDDDQHSTTEVYLSEVADAEANVNVVDDEDDDNDDEDDDDEDGVICTRVELLEDIEISRLKKNTMAAAESRAPSVAGDGGALFQCVRCVRYFETNTAYKVHIKACKTSRQQFICDTCGHVCRTRSALTIHVAMHNGINPFECDVCGKQFAHRGALVRHMPVHTGEKPYQCDKCGKQFIHYSSFHMHQLAHDDIRDKQCTICGMELRSNSHLTRHMRVHSGEKPYACPTCGQKFAQRYNMMTHYKAHQGIHRVNGRTHKCAVCKTVFAKAALLKVHMDERHPSGGVQRTVEVEAEEEDDAELDTSSVMENIEMLIEN